MNRLTILAVAVGCPVLVAIPLRGEVVEIEGGKVRFQAPDGFKPLAKEIINAYTLAFFERHPGLYDMKIHIGHNGRMPHLPKGLSH